MNPSGLLRKLCSLAIILLTAFLALTACTRSSHNWDSDVEDYLSGFHGEFIQLDSYKDASSDDTICIIQTRDDLQIVFELRCFWGYTRSPFGFDIPIPRPMITDNFAEQICAYISETRGTCSIDDKSIEEISSYVLQTIQEAERLMQEYGAEHVTPSITFTLIKGSQAYVLKYGNTNETMLRDKLTLLLQTS